MHPRRPRFTLLALLIATVALLAPSTSSAAINDVFGGDVSCSVESGGVRFCGGTLTTSDTFDGVPIDVNVGFPPEPATGPDNNYPLVMMFHGYGGSKIGLNAMRRWLNQGYATFSMTARGFHGSCGNDASKTADPAGCAAGYIRLMDTRYEVRDAQEFAGRLVDEGLVNPQQIGATGGSYGGGMSMALGALNNRKMLPDGTLAPWTSPNGTPLRIAAAAPEIPWTDLAYSLMPNGSTLDYLAHSPYSGRIGIKKSFMDGLYASGSGNGDYAPPGTNPDADITTWYQRINAGEPYDGDPLLTDVIDELTTHHSSYYIDNSTPPSPMLISNGWTDDLFPVDEAVRYYNRTRTDHPDADISLYFLDFGHPRGQNKAADTARLREAEDAWFDHYLRGNGGQPFQGVRALTQTCPNTAPSAGPYTARNWAGIQPGEVRIRQNAEQTVAPTLGGNASNIGVTFDPIFGQGACAQTAGDDLPGAATYRRTVPSGGFTMIGSPTVVADITLPGANSQLAARLLDVAPDGQQRLVARGHWRPEVSSTPVRQVFQLHPNGWEFPQGHTIKLELLPADSPAGRPSDGQQAVTVENLQLRLPAIQRPGARNGFVKAPAAKVVPEGRQLARDFAERRTASLRLAPGKRLNAEGGDVSVRLRCPAYFEACHRGRVRIVWNPKNGKGEGMLIARGPAGGTLTGGETRTRDLNLTRRGRKLLNRHDAVRVIAVTRSHESAEPTYQRRGLFG